MFSIEAIRGSVLEFPTVAGSHGRTSIDMVSTPRLENPDCGECVWVYIRKWGWLRLARFGGRLDMRSCWVETLRRPGTLNRALLTLWEFFMNGLGAIKLKTALTTT